MPFVEELRAELRMVEARSDSGFAGSERLPAQFKFVEWGMRCLELTEKWRGPGQGSVSVVYQVRECSSHTCTVLRVLLHPATDEVSSPCTAYSPLPAFAPSTTHKRAQRR